MSCDVHEVLKIAVEITFVHSVAQLQVEAGFLIRLSHVHIRECTVARLGLCVYAAEGALQGLVLTTMVQAGKKVGKRHGSDL